MQYNDCYLLYVSPPYLYNWLKPSLRVIGSLKGCIKSIPLNFRVLKSHFFGMKQK